MANSAHTDERSVADLIRELRDESGVLLKQQVALAKTEMSEKVSTFGSNLGQLIVGGAVAFLASIFLLLAVTGGLALTLWATELELHAIWLAPLIVGIVVAIVATVMITKAKQTLANASLVPSKTIETLKDDKQWAQAKVQ